MLLLSALRLCFKPKTNPKSNKKGFCIGNIRSEPSFVYERFCEDFNYFY